MNEITLKKKKKEILYVKQTKIDRDRETQMFRDNFVSIRCEMSCN